MTFYVHEGRLRQAVAKVENFNYTLLVCCWERVIQAHQTDVRRHAEQSTATLLALWSVIHRVAVIASRGCVNPTDNAPDGWPLRMIFTVHVHRPFGNTCFTFAFGFAGDTATPAWLPAVLESWGGDSV